MKKIDISGAGNLGIPIIEILLTSKHLLAKSITVTQERTTLLKSLKNQHVSITKNNIAAEKNTDIMILDLKSFKVEKVFQETWPVLDHNRGLLISVATGVSMTQLKKITDLDTPPIFRTMPQYRHCHMRMSHLCLC